tara:strand:- start:1303 stop:2082 length:780 start_codon:yes stop_codon:yes gene_type:complete
MSIYDLVSQVFLLLVSFISNFFSALAGGGAGLIQLPALLFLGLPFSIALATHKLASVFLGIGATLRHLQSNRFDKQFVLFVLLCGLPGVFFGANIVVIIPDKIASLLLGIITISLGIYSLINSNLGQERSRAPISKKDYFYGGFGLFFIGLLNGSLSSGTGLFVTLWLVRFFGISYTLAVAYTLILVGFFWNATGAIVLGLKGQIYWIWLPALVFGSLLGGYCGAHLSLLKGNLLVKRSFESICILMGFSLLIRSFHPF